MADSFVLGINAYDHDASACLLRNGEIVVAVNKERVTRIKHDAGFYQEVVDYCLKTAGIELERVDLVVRNCYVLPVREMERRLAHFHAPHHLTPREREQAAASALFLSDADRVVDVSHHLAHAYSAFAVSPFERGAVMVVDGVGGYRADATEAIPESDEAHPLARESESYYRFDAERLETVKKVWMGPSRGFLSDEFYAMPGLGALYSRVSTYIFGDWNKCGEVMGLAPYGRPGGEPLAHLENGELSVPDWTVERRNPFLGLSDRTWEASPHRREWEDLAWRVQEDTERVLVARAQWLRETTGEKNLCLAGGVALNCVANGKLAAESGFENVWIQPAAGDDGIAIGCACYGHLALKQGRRGFVMEHAFLGREYDRFDVGEAFRPWSARVATRRHRADNVFRETAQLLAEGRVVGWFQGRSEFGPRALGNRSILADPRDAAMKDRVNARVKHRQGFRPFAPAILAEKAHEYFEGEEESPFMLLVKTVRPEVRDKVPAIVHVDGTARVQTVREKDNPFFYGLLRAFEDRTGVPVLLNTSFNVRGDPIVEAPMDAMECFLYTHLDALVMYDWIVRKGLAYKLFRPAVRFFVQARRNLRSEALMERFARRALDA
ncbi:MAG: carbamoyltransferase family protein [Planctomycetota bacterium]|jgi:carbamoyltransferase